MLPHLPALCPQTSFETFNAENEKLEKLGSPSMNKNVLRTSILGIQGKDLHNLQLSLKMEKKRRNSLDSHSCAPAMKATVYILPWWPHGRCKDVSKCAQFFWISVINPPAKRSLRWCSWKHFGMSKGGQRATTRLPVQWAELYQWNGSLHFNELHVFFYPFPISSEVS